MTEIFDGFMWGILVTLTAISIGYKVEKWIKVWQINRKIKHTKTTWESQK
jgi:hypothetical protein